jgi:spore maturation protein CgeB
MASSEPNSRASGSALRLEGAAMRLVFFGLSLSSSWGNGHATTYRALLRGLVQRGHELHFLERDQPWYAANRDLPRPDFCRLALYNSLAELESHQPLLAGADAVVIGSYVPEAAALLSWVAARRGGLLCFYDIDTPVTLRKIEQGDHEYLSPQMIPIFDLYLSFTGGPTLRLLEQRYGARRAHALYCAADAELYQPTGAAQRWDLGYLGTYSADRQPALERLLLQVAANLPQRRFVVAGAQFPPDISWPANVERIEHLPPAAHADFYSSLAWTLNITRADMVQAGYSPSVRLFEASACGVPIISDHWPGLDDVFKPNAEILVARGASDVVAALHMSQARRAAIAEAGRHRTLVEHTGERRAQSLERLLRTCVQTPEIPAAAV